SAAIQDSQLIKQRRHEWRAARMPDGDNEYSILRVFACGLPRRKHRKSIGRLSPGARIVIGKGYRFESRSGQALENHTAQPSGSDHHDPASTRSGLVEGMLLADAGRCRRLAEQ